MLNIKSAARPSLPLESGLVATLLMQHQAARATGSRAGNDTTGEAVVHGHRLRKTIRNPINIKRDGISIQERPSAEDTGGLPGLLSGLVDAWEARVSYRPTGRAKVTLEAINLFDKPESRNFFATDTVGEISVYRPGIFPGMQARL